ncbi:hypothetical protein DV515_00006511 [Chloebia gouldiae]|uniref:Uncharacterized protein n=1 Tax=Chloebia gouldiae TaxID=44316 RepID=A0A3L8SK88_CHLGU|nr:hypothetical protein DV515_00006511 [Chloebia gouldiae]
MGNSFQTGSEIDMQAKGKCIKLFNCLEIQHNEHPKEETLLQERDSPGHDLAEVHIRKHLLPEADSCRV